MSGTSLSDEVGIMDNIDDFDTVNEQSYVSGAKTDPLCLAGLISSIVSLVCCCGTVSLVSLALSIAGVIRVKKSNDNGKGMAIAGIAISALSILILIMVIIFIVLPMILVFGFIGSFFNYALHGAYVDVSNYPVNDRAAHIEKQEISSIDELKDFLEDRGVTFDFKVKN